MLNAECKMQNWADMGKVVRIRRDVVKDLGASPPERRGRPSLRQRFPILHS